MPTTPSLKNRRIMNKLPFQILSFQETTEKSSLMYIGRQHIRTDIWIILLIMRKKHILSTAATLLHRASNLPSTEKGKKREIEYVTRTLKANAYPTSVILNIFCCKNNDNNNNNAEIIPSPKELVGFFFLKWATQSPKSYEKFARILISKDSPNLLQD